MDEKKLKEILYKIAEVITYSDDYDSVDFVHLSEMIDEL